MLNTTPHITKTQSDPNALVENTRVCGIQRLISPNKIKEQLPATEDIIQQVLKGRQAAKSILKGEDPRLLVVVGPCSIHDPEAALDYAHRLAAIQREVSDHMHLIMRVYFEKPRTTIGWKGLINDPNLDDSCDLAHGIALARKLLLDITKLGLAIGTEFLDPIIPQYIADLISWAAIGARTTESQTHRELASGLSMPVGFKNSTDGSVQTAIDAMKASRAPHSFLGIDQNGFTSIIKTSGNADCHVVLRGGREGTNYEARQTAIVAKALQAAELSSAIMIDCSHANSNKNPERQQIVWESILEQRAAGRKDIIGAMLESNIHAGSQAFQSNRENLQYGVSITDACIDWETTERLLRSV